MTTKPYVCRCEECGWVFEEHDGRRRVYMDGCVDYDCPACGCTSWEEVYFCDECDDVFDEGDMVGDICLDCFRKTVTVQDALAYGAEVGASVEINAVFAKAFTPLEINAILAREFETFVELAKQEAALKLALDDPYQYTEWKGGI